jgi:exosortase C (VPDSG-CTERM-specific)
VLGVYLIAGRAGMVLPVEDQLAATTASFLLIAVGTLTWFLGRSLVAALLFPLGMLAFLVPLPAATMAAIEALMQHGSAAVAKVLFGVFGTAVFYQDLIFQLPGINLHVAPECSGLRSTVALTIVSLVTGFLFLRSPVRRTILVVAILPLALLRNGFRIFTIGELCVHFGPEMIDSPLHRRGGPIFFALSLIPFFVLALLLLKNERRARPTAVTSS